MTTTDDRKAPQRQTQANPSGDAVVNPFANNRPADLDVKQAAVELDKEQQFKEAQTERD